MKKILSTVAAAAILAASGFANETPFISAGLGIEMAENMESPGIALIIGAGMPLEIDAGSGSVALEGELTHSIVGPEYEFRNYYGYWNTANAEVLTISAYGTYSIEIDKQMFIKPRVGLIYRDSDVSDGEFGIAIGVQGGYRLDNQLDIIVGLNFIDGMDYGHLTAGVQYHF